MLKTRTLIDAQHAGYTAGDRPNGPSHYGTDGPRRSVTFARAMFHTSNDTLGHSGRRQNQSNRNRGGLDERADHIFSPINFTRTGKSETWL
jgi:hypothetical protein